MSFLTNLIQGNLAIHQDLLNKFLAETIEDNKFIKSIAVSITGGLINLSGEIRTGENSSASIRLALSLGNFEFNRTSRFLELKMHGPVAISIHGIDIQARFSSPDPETASRAGAPEGLVNILGFLNVKEDTVTLDFNKMPGFMKMLQNKLGLLVLRNLEITRLELLEEMIVIHPSLKLF
ncbi:MAG: hypothetical protein HPY89_03455 [Pelotomaculum sp.]|nr:hypothetical protein [Pelotomaculum sp.]